MHFAHCLHLVLVIGKFTGIFGGGGGGQTERDTCEDLSMEEFFIEEDSFP